MVEIKAIILAAGKGTRLKPLTEEIPKSLIEVEGKTILERLLEILKEFNITEVGVVVSYKKEMVKEKIGDEFDGVKITYLEQEEPLGTANAIGIAEDFVGDEDFISLNGDLVFDKNIIRKLIEKDGYSVVIALKEYEDLSKLGVVKIENDLIKDILEKPGPGEELSKYGTIGIYRFSKRIFDAIKRTKMNEKRGEYEITDSMRILMKEDRVGYVICDEAWIGIENEDDLAKARGLVKNV